MLNVPSSAAKQVVQDEEEAKSSTTQSIRIGESLLRVTPSLAATKVYEIYDISYYHMVYT